jgi:hypothetical protein
MVKTLISASSLPASDPYQETAFPDAGTSMTT